jgi:hypothetical protein
MKFRGTIETTVSSYLTARPSGDRVHAARQRQTALWYEHGSSAACLRSRVRVRAAVAAATAGYRPPRW